MLEIKHLSQMIPAEWEELAFSLLQCFRQRWHRNAHTHQFVFSIHNQGDHIQIDDRQIHIDVLFDLIVR